MTGKLAIPPEVELQPVTSAELRRRMEDLLSRVVPRVVSDPSLGADEPHYTLIEPHLLVEELDCWTGRN